MKICLVSEPLFPVSGTSSRTLNLARALAQNGHGVWVVAPRETPDAPLAEEYEGFHIRRLKTFMPQKYGVERRNAFLKFLMKGGATQIFSEVLKVSRSVKADVLHYVNYYMSLCGVAFRKSVESSVFDIQASAFLESQGVLNKAIAMWIEKFVSTSGARIIVPTEELRAYLAHRYPRCEGVTDVVPLCIDVKDSDRFADKNHMRERFGLSEKDYLLVFHGSPYKSNIEALRKLKFVVDQLNAMGLNVRVLVLGFVGKFVSSPYFLSQGYVDDIVHFISAADLAVLPVDAPSLGMRTRILEYMSCGVPVVVLFKGACGYHEALTQNALVAAREMDELVGLSSKLLVDSSLREKITENASNYVRNQHSPRAVASQLESVYREF